MSKLSSGATYLNRDSVPAKRFAAPKRSPLVIALSLFFTMLTLFLSIQPLLDNATSGANGSPHAAQAGPAGMVCVSDLGMGMDDKWKWNQSIKVYPQEEATGRAWTLQEAFGAGLSFVNYEGEGGKDTFGVIEKPANEHKPGNYEAVATQLDGVRSWQNCIMSGGLSFVSTATLGLGSAFSSITQMFVVFAFDSNIVCEDPVNPSGVCLNLLKIIGGTGNSGEGMIGVLTSSIYLPLLIITVAITGFWVAYKGIVQRKLREAMFGAIWVALSVIFGLILLMNPMLLAKAPMAVSNVVGACVIGAFNGDNCMNGGDTGAALKPNISESSSSNICRSMATGGVSLDEQMSMTVNSLSCSIWKAFILEPYAQGSFGTSFDKLDTKSSAPMKAVIEKAGLNPDDFCLNLGSTGAMSDFPNTAILDRSSIDGSTAQVCNLLAYQMHLQTRTIASEGGSIPAAGAIDPRWYNVIVTAANDPGLWNQWSPSTTGALHKIGVSLLALITSLIGGFILIVIAFFALVYYLSAIIMMAFAPLFFLLGVHPGKGKKILLGWLEKVVSNVLKYLASAVFLIVAVSFYGAILGNSSNLAMTLLFVIIISGALFMYRAEIMDLLGKASMGGTQLSNSLTDKLKDSAKGTLQLGVAAAGSGIGSSLAGGSVTSGMADGVKRELQRGGASKILGKTGGDLVSNASRQFQRNSVDNAQDLKKAANDERQEKLSATESLVAVDDDFKDASAELVDFDNTLATGHAKLEGLEELSIKHQVIEDEAGLEMREENPFFAQAQLIANQMSAMKFDRALASANGDTETVATLDRDLNVLSNQRIELLNKVEPGELQDLVSSYDKRVADKLYRTDTPAYTENDERDRISLTINEVGAMETRERMVDRVNELGVERSTLQDRVASHTVKSEILSAADTARRPGDSFTKNKIDGILYDADVAAEEAINSGANAYQPIAHKTMDEIVSGRSTSGTPLPPPVNNNDRGPETPPNTPPNTPTDPPPTNGGGPTDGPTGGNRNPPTPQPERDRQPELETDNTPPTGNRNNSNSQGNPRTVIPSEPVNPPRGNQTQTEDRQPPPETRRQANVPTEPTNPPQAQPAPEGPRQPVAAPPTRAPQTPAPTQRPPEPTERPTPTQEAPRESGRRSNALPTEPNRSPRTPAQPAQPPRSAQTPVNPTNPAPSRSPQVPAQPQQPPATPRAASPEQGPRVAPQPSRSPNPDQAQPSVRLPTSPRASRIGNNSGGNLPPAPTRPPIVNGDD